MGMGMGSWGEELLRRLGLFIAYDSKTRMIRGQGKRELRTILSSLVRFLDFWQHVTEDGFVGCILGLYRAPAVTPSYITYVLCSQPRRLKITTYGALASRKLRLMVD